MGSKYYTGQEHLKKKSRDAARCRRGQQNDEYSELAGQLPFSAKESSQLDRLSVMRLANSFIKIKHFLKDVAGEDLFYLNRSNTYNSQVLENKLTQALDGFVFVIGDDGQFLFVSDNVSQYLGLLPVEVTGNSFYKFIHPCDHEEVAKQLGGKIPLEDMEIFDGLFCSDSIFLMSNNLKGGSSQDNDIGQQPYRSFFVRMKSTLTSRGKSVNLKASTYRVVHCMGCLKLWSPSNGSTSSKKFQPYCFVGIGVPLMFSPTFEVPLDRCTFTSHHALDMKFIYCEDGIQDILGYSASDVVGQSLYSFHHGVDNEVLTECHKTLLTKGQSVSGYYRLLAKYGGWVWVQTKASIVYASKTCQPQFVLCIHYAISDIQRGEAVLSLDQLRRIKEHQDSPTNSPSGKGDYGHVIKKLISNNHVVTSGTTLNLAEMSDKTSGGHTDFDAGYISPIALSIHEDEDMIGACTPDSQLSKDIDSGCEDISPSATDLYDNEVDMNPERCAPFIPPPFVDSPIFSECMEMGASLDETLGDGDLMWSNESWEIYDAEPDIRGVKEQDIKRNLSTPKFYPPEDDLPILNSNEIEMSTPISNLPLLQGNEIWFALDQGREVAV